ncbi:MAG TPA: rhomboid family intramembrane serine protease [Thermoanaerobaculia bacterium]|nr:rhomboid family intramembrane serine protease [Thermoanaerobaculia bacterium]
MANASGTLGTRAAALGTTTVAMWVVHAIEMLVPGEFALAHGIIPRTWEGIRAIPIAPFLHADLGHLAANTIPFLILGALVLIGSVGEFLFVVAVSALVGGAGIWMFGAGNAHHIGASGVIFGLFGYLVARSLYDHRWSSLLIAIGVALGYGTAMLYSLVPDAGISWTAHFFGLCGGVMAARMRFRRR